MTIAVGSLLLDPPVFLAPMAGITDLPFRRLVASFGAGLVVSEMVASQEMVQAKPGVREKAELGFGEQATSVQLAGRDAYWIAEAARVVEGNGAKIIDINMGCPAKKVTGGLSGAEGGNVIATCLAPLARMSNPRTACRCHPATGGIVLPSRAIVPISKGGKTPQERKRDHM